MEYLSLTWGSGMVFAYDYYAKYRWKDAELENMPMAIDKDAHDSDRMMELYDYDSEFIMEQDGYYFYIREGFSIFQKNWVLCFMGEQAAEEGKHI